jgi:hypothetical protein
MSHGVTSQKTAFFMPQSYKQKAGSGNNPVFIGYNSKSVLAGQNSSSTIVSYWRQFLVESGRAL